VLYSQSGAGKSSLLNTKVTMGLEREQCLVLPTARVQGKLSPNIKDADIRNIFSMNAILSLYGKAHDSLLSFHVEHSTISDFLGSRFKDRMSVEDPVILIFDQFEELFSFYEHRWPERTALVVEVNEALNRFNNLNVVFSLREDYIAKLDALAYLFPNRLRARYYLERLREGPAVEAVSGPVSRSGRTYDKEVAQAIVKDLLETQARDIQGRPVPMKGEFVEPVQLQVVCVNLWQSVPPEEKLITKDHLKQSGTVDEALRKFYDSSVTEIALKFHVSESELRRWFDTSLVTPAGTRGTVFRDVNVTAGMSNAVVDALENKHLIRADWRAGAQWYEITHDRLLRPIRESNRQWLRRVNKRRTLAIGTLGILGMIIGATGYVLLLLHSRQSARDAAEATRDAAEAARQVAAINLAANLVDLSSKLPLSSRDLALLLAVEAFQVNDSMRTRGNLLSQVQKADRIGQIGRIDARDPTDAIAVPGTELIAVISSDGELSIWNYRKRDLVMATPITGNAPFRLFADPSHLYVISAAGDGQIVNVQDMETNSGLAPKAAPDDAVLRRLSNAVKEASAAAALDLAGSNTPLQPDPEVRRTVAFAAGRLLTVRGGAVTITDQNGAEIAKFEVTPNEQSYKIRDVGLSPDGKLAFAFACGVATKRDGVSNPRSCGTTASVSGFWDVERRQKLAIGNQLDQVSSMAINGSDRQIFVAEGNNDGSVAVREYKVLQGSGTANLVRGTVLAAAAPLTDVIFPEGPQNLIAISGGGILTSWQLDGPSRLERKVRDGMSFDVAIAESGTLATIGPEGYAVVDVDGRTVLSGRIENHFVDRSPIQDILAAVSIAKDGKRLLVAQYGQIELWDIVSGRQVMSLNIAPAGTASIAYDPRGRYVASGFISPEILIKGALPGNDAAAPAIDFSHVPILWRVDSGQPELYLDFRRGVPINKSVFDDLAVGVSFSPDGRIFVVTQNSQGMGTIHIYTREENGTEDRFGNPKIVPFDGHPYWLTFLPDGTTVAVSNSDGTIVFLDVRTGQPVGKMQIASMQSRRLAASPDGKLLAVKNLEGDVGLWEILSRTPFGSPIRTGHAPDFQGLAFTPDSAELLVGDEWLNSLVAFDLRAESWVRQACAIAGRTLTSQESVNYFLPLEGPRPCAPK
jgi:WD40 repeat protein